MMEDKIKKNLDQVFNEKLGNQQATFEEQDWQKMLALLEQDEVVPVVPINETNKHKQTNKNNWINLKTLIIMTTLALITALMTLWGTAVHENTNLPALMVEENPHSSIIDHTPRASNSAFEYTEKPAEAFSTPSVESTTSDKKTKLASNQQGSKNPIAATKSDEEKPPVKNAATEVSKNPATQKVTPIASKDKKDQAVSIFDKINELPANPLPPIDSLKKAQKFYKSITHEVWVEDRYEYIYQKPKHDIEDFWIGMHYTQQRPDNQPLYDSMGLRDVAHGFNLQFMSGNLLKGEYLAIYGGLDWGMQFYGRTKDSEVLINSTNQDKGLTFLRNNSTDILARFHFEYAQFPVIPYFNIAGGPRILMTHQHVSALVTAKDYESSNTHNVSAEAALMGSVGVGLRVKISPSVSVDARYEQYYGGKTEIVDLHNSQFNGAEYTLSKNKISTNSSQFKVGFIFDLSSREQEKKLVEPGHYETRTERYYLDASDTNKIIQPCPCGPCDDKKDNSIYEQGGIEENPYGTRTRTNKGINTGSGTFGGGKKPFPGVKSVPKKN